MGPFGENINYYLTDPEDFPGSYFTLTLLFFFLTIVVTSVTFCHIGRLHFYSEKKSFIERVFFYTNFNFNSLIICNIKVLNIVIFSVVLNPLPRKTLNQCSLVSNFDFLGINSFVSYGTNLS